MTAEQELITYLQETLDNEPDAQELNLHDHDINELTEEIIEQIAEFT